MQKELLLGNWQEGVGAGDGLRTRYLNLGKVALYRVSYSRVRVVAPCYLKAWAPSSLVRDARVNCGGRQLDR